MKMAQTMMLTSQLFEFIQSRTLGIACNGPPAKDEIPEQG